MSTDTTTETFVSPKDLAQAWGTDPKSVRRFLRANTSNRAGKGGRWEISTDDVETLTAAWLTKATTVKFQPKEEAEVTDEVAVAEGDDLELEDDMVDLEDIDDEI